MERLIPSSAAADRISFANAVSIEMDSFSTAIVEILPASYHGGNVVDRWHAAESREDGALKIRRIHFDLQLVRRVVEIIDVNRA